MSKLIHAIQSEINQKSYNLEVDNSSVHGFLKNKRGNRFKVNGHTGFALIKPVNLNRVDVEINYTGNYIRNHFIGIRSEYRTETQDTRGLYRFQVSQAGVLYLNENEKIVDFGNVSDRYHDSNVYTIRGIEEKIISKLDEVIKQFNIEEEISMLFSDLLEKFSQSIGSKKNEITTVHYHIKGKIVQFINSNNGLIVGESTI